ncbi:MAG: hypothetical protein JNK45_00520 [Myxococcales bacterium]|nr:hypothetical protein [Myxococcales bacterium]
MRALATLPFALVVVLFGCAPSLDDPEEPMNVCTYESASCFDDSCPPGDDAYTVQCIDTTLTSCTISEEVTSEYDIDVDTTFYFYTRNVQWMAGITCEDVL